MFNDFKDFISQRNTVDMCIGIIIGSALTSMSKSLTNNLINPLIGLVFGKIDFAKLSLVVGHSTFQFGAFINSLISFMIIALITFVIYKFFAKFTDYEKPNPNEKVEQLLTEILKQDKLNHAQRKQ